MPYFIPLPRGKYSSSAYPRPSQQIDPWCVETAQDGAYAPPGDDLPFAYGEVPIFRDLRFAPAHIESNVPETFYYRTTFTRRDTPNYRYYGPSLTSPRPSDVLSFGAQTDNDPYGAY